MSTNRWPLHPQPRPYETLEAYVHRLADGYGVRYDYFCRCVLEMPYVDNLQEPSPDVLRYLSGGTGVPIEQLAQMTWHHVWNRIMDQLAVASEGRGGHERLWGILVSQKS